MRGLVDFFATYAAFAVVVVHMKVIHALYFGGAK